jgi:hypothetical protein
MGKIVAYSIAAVICLMIFGCGSTRTMMSIREIDRPLTLPRNTWQAKENISPGAQNSYTDLTSIFFPSCGITDNVQFESYPNVGLKWRFCPLHQPDSNSIAHPWNLALQCGIGQIRTPPVAAIFAKKKMTESTWFDGSIGGELDHFHDSTTDKATYLYPVFLRSNLGIQFTDNFYLKTGLSLYYKNFKGELIKNNSIGRCYEIGLPATLGFNVSRYFSFAMCSSLAFDEIQTNSLIRQYFSLPTTLYLIFQW